MLAIDTNLVVRYLTNDHPKHSLPALTLIDSQPVFVPVTVVLGVEWALRSTNVYRTADVARALELAERGMDFADALHLCKTAHCEPTVSFDRRFVRVAKAAGHDTVRGSLRPPSSIPASHCLKAAFAQSVHKRMKTNKSSAIAHTFAQATRISRRVCSRSLTNIPGSLVPLTNRAR